MVRKLAAELSDGQIACVLSHKGFKTPTGLPYTSSRVAGLRFRNDIEKGPRLPASGDDIYTPQQAAKILGVTHTTVVRWVELGLLKGEQLTEGAPWRVRINDADRARLVADQAPADWVSIKTAASMMKVSGQTILNKLKTGELEGLAVRNGQHRVWKIQVPTQRCESQQSLFT